MNSKGPQDSSKYEWTEHSKYKMKQYGLSAQRVLRVIRSPKRIEEGIVEKTIAVMQPAGNVIKKDTSKLQSVFTKVSPRQFSSSGESWSQEIWVMYQIRNQQSGSKNQEIKKLKSQIKSTDSEERAKKLMKLIPKKLRIISAWRYPGVSDENSPIPDEIMREIEDII